MENSTLRALEGVWVALCAVLPPEGVQAVNNVLATFADHPNTPLPTAIAYRQMIYAAEPLAEPETAGRNALPELDWLDEIVTVH